MPKYKKIAIIFCAPLLIATAVVPVLAENTSLSGGNVQKAEAVKRVAEANIRLKEDKLKLCQGREAHIDNIMDRIGSRGQVRYNVITAAAERTEKFYTDKGKVLSNYDQLVAAVTAKKVAAQAAIDAAKASKTDFKCDGSDPKGAAASFKTKVQAMDSALKDYRTAVKNLIVGVKSVQGTTSSEGSH